MRKILLSLVTILVVSVAFAGDFTRDNTAETVTDSTNSLMWQDDAVVASGKYTWSDAISYCENLDLAGHTDWRLPTINELRSIVDYDVYSPAIASIFQNVAVNLSSYWSSTTRANYTSHARVISFTNGSGSSENKTYNYYVRCVR